MKIQNVEDLEAKLAETTPGLIDDLRSVEGDIMILGLGGKMGPSLAKLAVNAIREGGLDKKVLGASRFSNKAVRDELEAYGVQTLAGDLLDEDFLQGLPDCKNVIFMAGNKFGTSGNEHFTWAMNAYLPGRVAEKYKDSRIVVFSSGNIYPFMPVDSSGADEATPPSPIGEYAQSCLGRERVFEHFAIKNATPMLIFRLNYAVDLRYGVLCEVAKAVFEQRPIDITTAYVNVIWQGDANSYALRSLRYCKTPPQRLNCTGPELISIEGLARKFGELMGKPVEFTGTPAPTALLNDASYSFDLMGRPRTGLDELVEWTAHWVMNGGEDLGKPTHFQQRKGNF
ncbi:NAD-dependent epimerase/dehydratase family protein [Pseudozobellia thermophila]|uniref:Nucleoside-diphosphate-sugar epimerase n=1 Tax=Pseudozobellia thermophila TaxID=192903 RepID=A0A1M6BBB5_9FLAO|nr:NAD(P)-dependent oxidoreductase [Pseudozobellia thermophila]SHI46041.1 Nucleoside-diphosphate-sugar epimerase [Pseudozobellia thermophila]